VPLYEKIYALAKQLCSAGIGYDAEDAGRQLQGLIAQAEQAGLSNIAAVVTDLHTAKAFLVEGSLKPACERLGAASRKLRGPGNFVP
jgi:hypothetical protein